MDCEAYDPDEEFQCQIYNAKCPRAGNKEKCRAYQHAQRRFRIEQRIPDAVANLPYVLYPVRR